MRHMSKNGSTSSKNTQVTLMNTRSQAGSATMQKGTIEMIQNRRMIYDDNLGVGENLNETDKNGYGMKVNARYWLDIFDVNLGKSSQRKKQSENDQPLTLFFASLNGSEIQDNQEILSAESSSTVNLHDAYTSDYYEWDRFGKVVFFPLWKNKILVRLENIADRFDTYAPTLKLNMEKFAYIFWMMSNPMSKSKYVPTITEVALTANMLEKELQEMRKKRQWKAKNDAEIAEKLSKNPELKAIYERDPMEDKLEDITLVPQDLRSFVISFEEYKPSFIQ